MVIHQKKDIIMEFAALKQLFIEHGDHKGVATIYLAKGEEETIQEFAYSSEISGVRVFSDGWFCNEDSPKRISWDEFEKSLSRFESIELSGEDFAQFNFKDGISEWSPLREKEYHQTLFYGFPPRMMRGGYFLTYGKMGICQKNSKAPVHGVSKIR